MPSPVCAQNCEVDLPPVSFDKCAPVIKESEIRRIFLAKEGAAPFANWLAAAEWTARISPTNIAGNDYIRALTVIADKPAGSSVVREISNGRRQVLRKDRTINVTVDEMSQANYEFFRVLDCGGTYRIWWETAGGMLYGGNEGVLVQWDGDTINNRGADEIETITGTFTWRAKFNPDRGESPIYDGDNGGGASPGTYDTSLTFATGTSDASDGVTGTVSASDADQVFEFNKISPRVGAPQSMSIEVSGVEEITVAYTADYNGTYFSYTDKGGTPRVGYFYNGTVNF